ncbi:MAG: hypothetical protein LBQ35_09245 [Spirochaetaceae bacterium]|nr:hypothetical protein [Spirochaetaceae bacterium]
MAGFAVLLMAAMFAMTGCDTGINPGEDDEGFTISGSFTKTGDAGSGEVKFDLKGDADSYALSGVLEDGGLTIRLKGSYDPNTGRWSVSAKSSSIIYTLDGIVDSAGAFQAAGATIVVKSGTGAEETWIPYIFPVTEGAVSIPDAGTAEDGETGGAPAVWQGNWYSYTDHGGGYTTSINVLISDWKASVSGISTSPDGSSPIEENWTLIELTESGGGSYEYIGCYPYYVMTSANLADAVGSYLGPTVTVTPGSGSGVSITITAAGSSSSLSIDVAVDGDTIFASMGGSGEADFEGAERDILDAAWEKLRVFWRTNGWEQWAAGHNAEKANKYVKARMTLTNSNTFTMIEMVKVDNPSAPWYYTDRFTSLAALRAAEANLIEKRDWNWSTSPPTDNGVEVMTFTR